MNEDVSGERGDGEGGAYRRLRGELLSRMNNGRYPLGTLLPAQRVLAEELGVSRDTVQRVLKELAVEGWVLSRQGSGTMVIRGQSSVSSSGGQRVSLEQLMDEAFQGPEVTLDVYTLSSESLAFQIQRQELEIRLGRRPKLQAITLRMLLPDEDLADRLYPKAVNDEDDEAVWERHLDTTRGSTASIQGKLKGLMAEELVSSVDIQIRHVRKIPEHKRYLVNGSAMLSALYVPVKRPIYLVAHNRYVDAIDVLGVGAPLTYDVKDDDPHSQASEKVDNAQMWFNSTWDLLAK
ncbi:winged helix-turn-helix domain-containing protein [Streptomyces sp. NPDC005492]|uniref:winged helix-turn-helix domain-containing protein n=1 Tax=Streptomyces sp. NPDC005492 TaxID=3156883 RepID=UPI0033AFDD60